MCPLFYCDLIGPLRRCPLCSCGIKRFDERVLSSKENYHRLLEQARQLLSTTATDLKRTWLLLQLLVRSKKELSWTWSSGSPSGVLWPPTGGGGSTWTRLTREKSSMRSWLREKSKKIDPIRLLFFFALYSYSYIFVLFFFCAGLN